jgi:signal transduction histidine kinase
MWRFETLVDFALVTRWLEKQRRKGSQHQAFAQYFRRITPILRGSVDRYQQCAEEFDTLSGGLLTHTTSARWPGLKLPSGVSMLENLQRLGRGLASYFDNLQARGESQFISRWMTVVGSWKGYVMLLERLVGDFGSFEALVPMLPGTGAIVTNHGLQRCLAEMFHINVRNLRLIELGRGLHEAWWSQPPRMATGFFEPKTDLRRRINGILIEYMVQADPERIRARQAAAKKKGRPYTRYRFWRPAENLRLMAEVTYEEESQRKPVMHRPYVRTQLERVPPICTDVRRLEWSLKEILNNSLSACSRMYLTSEGGWIARPLDRHAGPKPSPAIHVTLHTVWQKRRYRQRPFLRIVIRDEGVGIPPEDLPHVLLCGYSPRRAEFQHEMQEAKLSRDRAYQEIQIGGKGIGLTYAAEFIREHGGELHIDSVLHEGTCVTIDLPIPTVLRL